MKVFQPGECAQVYGYNTDNDGALTDATSVIVTITDPEAAVVVDEAAMIKIATGEYTYDYDISSEDIAGVYRVEAVFTTSGHVTKEFTSFRVK